MNRRDFLRPRHLARSAGQVLAALDDLRSTVEACSRHEETALLRAARRAMATTFEVLLPFGLADGLTMAENALDEIDRLEDQLTVYRDHSEVSRINRGAFERDVAVEPGLFALLRLAARLTAETEGAFDVTTGALIKGWGFYRRSGRVPSDAERAELLSRVGMRHVVLDAERTTVRFRVPGLEINLGSIGKGYALDRVAESLRETWNLPSALLHGGQSSVCAIGSQPGERRGWPVGIRYPWDPERRLALVWLKDRSLATSAATFQHLEYNGRKLGHILDPRTGWPAERIASATVLAPTGAEADALATAFYVLGANWARPYCEQHPQISALILPAEGPLVVLGSDSAEIELTCLAPEKTRHHPGLPKNPVR